jgi:DNA-binding NarL/FixJ family response regulator
MSSHRIVLANEARFMRTTLRRLLDKSDQLEVVAEVDDLQQIPAVLERTQADWLLVSLPEENGLPSAILTELQRFPDLRVLAVSRDGSRTRVEWLEQFDQETGEFSVERFLNIFNDAH